MQNTRVVLKNAEKLFSYKKLCSLVLLSNKMELVLSHNDVLGHPAKTLAFDDKGNMFVNYGSLTNNCQIGDRRPLSPGQFPCAELA